MSEPLHDIDKLFRDNIEGHSEQPAANVWDKIESGLDKNIVSIYKQKYRTVKRVAIILFILFSGVLLYELLKTNPGKGDLAGENKTIESTPSSQPKQEKSTDQATTPSNQNPSAVTNQDNLALPDGKSSENIGTDKISSDENVPPASTSLQLRTNKSAAAQEIPGNPTHHRVIPGKPGLHDQDFVVQTEDAGKKQIPFQTRKQDSQQLTSADMEAFPSMRDFDRTHSQPLKNVNDVLRSAFAFDENGSAAILAARSTRSNKLRPVHSNRGFSVQTYILPSAVVNSLEDDKPHRPGSGMGPGGPVQDRHEIERHEGHDFAYTAGIKVSYAISDRLSFQTGLGFLRSETSENPKVIYAESDNTGQVRYRLDCSAGYSYLLPKGSTTPTAGDNKTVSDTKNTVSYLQVPLNVEYRITNGKLSLSTFAGTQINKLIKGKTATVFDKGGSSESTASNSTEGLRASYLSAQAGIIAELKLNSRLSITLAPTGQFALSSINKHVSVKTHPNYLGASAGLKIKL